MKKRNIGIRRVYHFKNHYYRLVNDISTLPDPQAWAGLRGIGRVECERHKGGRVSYERRYFITSLVTDIRAFARAVRAHWGVENCLHWRLDVTLREDESRIRRANAPANLNTLRQFALNLLKRARPDGSVKQNQFKASWDDDFRANVVFQQ
ncbi:MAG: Mobile element protein [Olavius algarvensis Gamma 1 endosymbiont]|nr:MAG: Mobile element protein [Olavius algarvensis Gamma 1 endosymbiont]